jgi:RimJ/RimL family protein N-acetyltransferase
MDQRSDQIPKQFESERLVLRCYQHGDGEMIFGMGQRNRAHLERYESGNALLSPKNPEEAEALARELDADWEAGRCYFIGAFDKATHEFVAQVYVGVVSRETPEYEIVFIVDQAHEGQGFVLEAVKATLGIVFKRLGAHRVSLRCDETNTRSYRVAERCGFNREGHLRENKRNPDGSRSGTFIYGLLKSEYKR